MNDKELLELAAKASGYKGQWDKDWWAMCDGENHWDPLRHNGQALRLAVKLGFTLSIGPYGCMVRYDRVEGDLWIEERRPGDGAHDIAEATRRAIVRAAAEIGKTVGASTAPKSEKQPEKT